MDDLPQSVMRKLDASKGTWREIADVSGVSYSWLTKFAQGGIKNPGYYTLQKIVAYFATKK